MPEYDDFADTSEHWSETASPYSRVEAYSFFKVLGAVRGLSVLDLAAGISPPARGASRAC